MTARPVDFVTITVKHLILECSKSKELWQNITDWIYNKLGTDLDLLDVEKLLGWYNKYAYWIKSAILGRDKTIAKI